MTPDEALDLVSQRTAIRLSMMVRNKDAQYGVRGSYTYREKQWERDLKAIDAELIAAGLLKKRELPADELDWTLEEALEVFEEGEPVLLSALEIDPALLNVGEAEPDNVVTLWGSNQTEHEATDPGSANRRPCSFCNDTGEKTVDMEIDGFVYEVVVDCYHP